MIPAMRLEFIDFDTFRDSHGTVRTLDWHGLIAGGSFLWPYMECLRWSRARRAVTFGGSNCGTPTLDGMWPDIPGPTTYFDAGPRGPHDTYEPWLRYGNPGSGYIGVTTIQMSMMLTQDILWSMAWLDDLETTIPRVLRCLEFAGSYEPTDSEYFAHVLNHYEPSAILADNKYDRLFRVCQIGGLYRIRLPIRPPTADFMRHEGRLMRWLETHNAVP